MKQCGFCKEWKPLSAFYKNGKHHFSKCKECIKKQVTEYQLSHKGEIARHYQVHKKKRIQYQKEYRKTHQEQIIEYAKEYYQRHKKELTQYSKEYQQNHREELFIYRQTHKKEYNRWLRQRRTIPRYKLNSNMTRAITLALKGNKNGHHWETLVGYSLQDLKRHLEKQFSPEMNWSNYGSWEIDHIVPISKFNFDNANQLDFQRCWALSNLRPLGKSENRVKNAKINKPFQPSLLL